MPYCPKCGAKIDEEMTFCPKCGAPVKAEEPQEVKREYREYRRKEKEEKHEKEEKGEKAEKHEKREYSFVGPLVGGLILIFLGCLAYLSITMGLRSELVSALFLIIVGVLIIIGGLYAVTVARRRHPTT